jgi:prephenate dehydratase/prephenate dehydrogenase
MIENENVTVGIIGGKGKMGRLFADFFKQNGCKVFTSDIGTKLTNEKLAAKCDVVIVSVPIDQTTSVIKKVVQHTQKGGLLMDLTSVKVNPVKAMLKSKGEVIGLHPMFSETTPMRGQTIVMCPVRSKKWQAWTKKLFINAGLNIKTLTPKEHDKMMSQAQALVHFADIVFGDAMRELKTPVKTTLKYTSIASDLKIAFAGRLLAQDPNLYGNIQIENPSTLKAIKAYAKSVNTLINIVEKKDLKKFTSYFLKSQKFLKGYAKKSYEETDWMIAKILQKRHKSKAETLPKKGEIGVIGPAYTYSDVVTGKYFKKASKAYFNTIGEVFEAVTKGHTKKGVVPIENLLHGTVRETLDELFKNKLKITGEISFPIHHCLISHTEAKQSDIKKIFSHSQAIQQCSNYLKKKHKKAEIVNCSSTAFALQKILQKNDKSIAVIGAKEAAHAHNLKILKEKIEDSKENRTTFVTIAKKANTKAVQKTSIAFYFAKDKPGSLFMVFQDFAKAKVNMTKIESRPARKELGEYVFFLDFEGDTKDPKVKRLLQRIKSKTKELKIFGTYDRIAPF